MTVIDIPEVSFNEFRMLPIGSRVIVKLSTITGHGNIIVDCGMRNENVKLGVPLCEHCDGTSNIKLGTGQFELCKSCIGTGVEINEYYLRLSRCFTS